MSNPKNDSKIFSGDYSVSMWNEINQAKTIAQLRDALYTICCRIQELEAKVDKYKKSNNPETVRR